MKYCSYVGSGPYCYANSFSMMFGEASLSPAVIEFATGSPFGMQLHGGAMPFFDPYGWTPEAGFEDALAAMGWSSAVMRGGSEAEALSRLVDALAAGPVWAGPLEMGHLRHQPGMHGAIGADHYVVGLALRDGMIEMHDPQGYPHATLPLADFMAAWRGETVDYGEPYTMRTGFQRVETVPEDEAIRRALSAGIRWLAMDRDMQPQAGTLGNEAAALALAERVAAGCDDDLRGHLIHFAVRVGARRAADAARCLTRIGLDEAAGIMGRQAQLIGALQHPLVARDDATAAAHLRALAPTYRELLAVLEPVVVS
ncbi:MULTISPECIES: hypothetical protein [Bosea]|uniref:hypothetical protein n=1 Tax=Bosea TaxID=85413 RepID=UPI00214FBF74|nr:MULTISPECIES: hypothetical protein [Bosea]MCR4519974.1 hypothetical protein [Bosea sp. 47.2.35]